MRTPPFPRLDLALSPSREELERLVPDVAAMRGCMQDPVFHAEGDVILIAPMTLLSVRAAP